MYHGQSFVNHTLESEVADKPRPKRSKREDKEKKLEQDKLAPSSASWSLLGKNGDLPNFAFLFTLVICSVMDLIRKNSLPTNEGHSILLCGTLLPHIVEDLNEPDKLYRFSIYPIIEEEEDR